jgi:sulfate adenylyltransferase (ADP) / ATP adenylyltransferase
LTVIQFQLRYCPALAKKPKPSSTESGDGTTNRKPDPFENPPPDLLIAALPKKDPSHNLVLNKYPVIPNHSIIATKTAKPQTDVLEEDDLAITHACLRAWREGTRHDSPRRLFAFFNSGEHSGASQPHRHLQFLPFEDMVGSNSTSEGWALLVDKMNHAFPKKPPFLHNPSIPFHHYALRISPRSSSRELHQTYLTLYSTAVEAVREFNSEPLTQDPLEIKDPAAAAISYNLAMTEDIMVICPRRSEAAVVPSSEGEGSVAVNGTILAGTLMVKDPVEWDSLRQDPDLLTDILTTIGFPVECSRGESANNKL